MITRFLNDRSRTPRRDSFTLIELLVVIAIIAALMALSASAVISFMGVQQKNNTQSTLDRTQSQLAKAWSKVKNEAYRESIPVGVDAWIRANLAGSDANMAGRVRVIYVKLKLRQAFPMSFTEALNGNVPAGYPLPPLPAYAMYLTSLGITGSSPASANLESSACLLMALQRGVSGAGIDPSELNKGGAAGNYTTPSGGNLPYLMDAWGTPIYFTRVPAGYIVLNPQPYPGPPGPGQPGANDPGDPQGYLNAGGWPLTANTALFTQLTLQPLAAQNCSYKLSPMLASAGLDKQPQFNAVTFQMTPGADDLFSLPP